MSFSDPPNGGLTAWSNVAAAFLVMAHTPAVHYIYGLIFVEWLEAFPASSRATVAGCGSLSTGLMLAAAYASGSLQAWGMPPGRVVALGAVLAVVGLLATSMATTMWQCYLFFSVVVGLAHALTFPPCPLVASSWFTTKKNVAVGMATSGSGAGTMYLGLVVAAVLRSSGWRAAFRILAALSAVAIGGAALVLRIPGGASVWSDLSCSPSARRKRGKGGGVEDGAAAATASGEGAGKAKEKQKNGEGLDDEVVVVVDDAEGEPDAPSKDQRLPVCMLLRDARLVWLCAAYFVVSFAWEVPFVHLTAFALDVGTFQDGSSGSAWWLTVGIGAGGLLGRIVVTRLADLHGRQTVFVAVLGCMAATHFMLPSLLRLPSAAGAKAAAVACAVLIGTGTGTLIALVVPLAENTLAGRSEEARDAAADGGDTYRLPYSALPQASGLVYSMLAVGIVLGPAMAGALFDATGSYDLAFYLCGASSACAAVAALVLACRVRSSQHESGGDVEFASYYDEDDFLDDDYDQEDYGHDDHHRGESESVAQEASAAAQSATPAKQTAEPKPVREYSAAELKGRAKARASNREKRRNEYQERWNNEAMHRALARPGEAPVAGTSMHIFNANRAKSKSTAAATASSGGAQSFVSDCDAASFKVRGPNYGMHKASSSSFMGHSVNKTKTPSAPAMFESVGADCVISNDGMIAHFASTVVLPWCHPPTKGKGTTAAKSPESKEPSLTGRLGEPTPQYLEDRLGKGVPAFLIFNLSAPVDPLMKNATLFPSYPIGNGSKGQKMVNQVFYFRLSEGAAAAIAQIEADEEERFSRAEERAASRDKLPSAPAAGDRRSAPVVSTAKAPNNASSNDAALNDATLQPVSVKKKASGKHKLGRRRSLPGKGWEVGMHMMPKQLRRHTVEAQSNESTNSDGDDESDEEDVAAHAMALSRAEDANAPEGETDFLGDGLNWALDFFGGATDDSAAQASAGSPKAATEHSKSAANAREEIPETEKREDDKGEPSEPIEVNEGSSLAPRNEADEAPSHEPVVDQRSQSSPNRTNDENRVHVSGAARLMYRWCRDCLDDAEVAGQLKFIGKGLNLQETDCPAIGHAYNGTPVLISDFANSETSSYSTSLARKSSEASPNRISEATKAAARAHNSAALAAAPNFQVSPPNPGRRRFNNSKPGMRPGVCEIYRGPNYIEVDLDIAKWYAYLAQRTIAWGLSNMYRLDLDGAFLLEGRKKEELPECVLGCISIRKWPVSEAPLASESSKAIAASEQLAERQRLLSLVAIAENTK